MNRKLPDITESALKSRLRSESVGYKKQRLTLFCKGWIDNKSLT